MSFTACKSRLRTAWCIGGMTVAFASTMVCQAATIIAAGDAYIQGGTADADSNFNNSSLTIKNTGNVSSTSRLGYLYFTPGVIDDPISSASLNLSVITNSTTTGSTPWTVQVYGLATESLDTWSESTITWNNSPGHTASSFGFNSDAIYLGDLSIPAGELNGTYSFTSAALLNFLNADTDGRVTFMLTRTTTPSSGFNLAFASSEHPTAAFHPSLTYMVVPEPGKASLLALSGLALLHRRRR